MMGGSSLATVSRYARWFLDGSCGNSHTVLRSTVTVLNKSITGTGGGWCCLTITWTADNADSVCLDRKHYNSKMETLWSTKWVVSNYHQVFKFPIKLLKFAGKFLWKQMTVKVNLQLGYYNYFETVRYSPPRSDSTCTLLGYSVPWWWQRRHSGSCTPYSFDRNHEKVN